MKQKLVNCKQNTCKMSRYLILLVSLFISLSTFSQHSINGKVVDNNGESLSYATVTLLNPSDSTLKFFGVTKSDGVYQIKNIKADEYILQFSFVGMETSSDKISIPSAKGDNLGIKKMKPSALQEVEVMGEYVPISFKSDTVEFNSKAFTTKPHDVAEDLLKKIPGIEVDESGNLKALGEDVQKVLVDGKEFFGKDTKVATKNLPANSIEKVQVYDKRSEEADFMGIDDGVRDRTINLILDAKHKKGSFGDVEAGYGTDEHYKLASKLYRFTGKTQMAVLGMYNNVNEFGYSRKGHGNFGQQVNGLNTTGAGGLNWSYNPKDKNRYFLSYLGRSTKTILEQDKLKESFSESGSFLQDSDLDRNETDSPHDINLGVRHNFNKNQKLTIDGDANIANNSTTSRMLTNTSLNGLVLNSWDNTDNNNSNETGADAKVVYIAKLNNGRTQLKTNIKGQYEETSTELDWINLGTFYNPDQSKTQAQFRNNDINKTRISANPTVVQEIKQFWYLSANMAFGWRTQNLDRSQGNPEENTVIDSLGASFTTHNNFIRPAVSLRRSTANKQFNISLGVGFDGQSTDLPGYETEDKSYVHLLPSFSYNNSYKKGRKISFRYNSDVDMPAVNQLLPLVNNLNPLSLYSGNLDLKPEYSHSLIASWSIFDQYSFTSLFSRLNAGYTKDKIALSQIIHEDFSQTIMPVNVKDHYTAGSFIYFSTPIRPLGLELRLNSHESWNRGINMVNGQENVNTNLSHSVKLSFSNRNKEKWYINVGGSISLTNSKFSIADSLETTYYNSSYFVELRYSPVEKWNFEADGNIVNYNAKDLSESISIPMLNAAVSYYFLKGNKGSISIKGYDLLDKSQNITQMYGTNFIQQVESNVLGRRIMLELKVKFGK